MTKKIIAKLFDSNGKLVAISRIFDYYDPDDASNTIVASDFLDGSLTGSVTTNIGKLASTIKTFENAPPVTPSPSPRPSSTPTPTPTPTRSPRPTPTPTPTPTRSYINDRLQGNIDITANVQTIVEGNVVQVCMISSYYDLYGNDLSIDEIGKHEYKYKTTIDNSDPGLGYVKFDKTNMTLSSSMYISAQSGSSINLLNYFRNLTRYNRIPRPFYSYFKILQKSNLINMNLFKILDVVNNVTFVKIVLQHIDGVVTSYSADEEVILIFNPYVNTDSW